MCGYEPYDFSKRKQNREIVGDPNKSLYIMFLG